MTGRPLNVHQLVISMLVGQSIHVEEVGVRSGSQ
jgi:hypothetical protein